MTVELIIEQAVADLDEMLVWLEASPQRRNIPWSKAEERLLRRLWGRIPRPELARRITEVLRRETGLPDVERSVTACAMRAQQIGLPAYSGEGDEYYLKEAADACGIQYEYLHAAATQGELPTRRVAHKRLVKQRDLALWYRDLRERLLDQAEMLEALAQEPLASKQEAMQLTGLAETHIFRYLSTGVITAWQLPNLKRNRPGEWLVERRSVERFIRIRAEGGLKELLDSNPAYVALRNAMTAEVRELRRAGRLEKRDPLTEPKSSYHPGCFTVAQVASHVGLSAQSLYEAINRGQLRAVAVKVGGRNRYAIEPAEARRFARWVASRPHPVAGWHNRRRRDIAEAGLLTVKELIDRWQVDERTITRYIHQGLRGHRLPSRHWGRYRVFEVEHLRQSYEDFINTMIDNGHDVGYWDGFMGAHNFHCLVLLDLEEKMQLDPAGQLLIRNMAITTFKESLERRP